MAELQETLEGALEDLKGRARVEDAVRIRGNVKIINKDHIRALVERFVRDFGTDPEMAAKLGAVESELGALKQKLQALVDEKAALEKQLADADVQAVLARMAALQAERDQAVSDREDVTAEFARTRETLEEKLRKLEAIIAASDLQSRVKDLEYELIELREAYRQASIGLEFIDLIEDVDYNKLLAEISGLTQRLAALEGRITDTQKPYFAYLKGRVAYMEHQLKADVKTFSSLVDAMNDNKGSVGVIVDLIRVALRGKSFRDEVNLANCALALV